MRVRGALATLLPAALLVAVSASPPSLAAAGGRTLNVPGDFATPDAAIAASAPGDVILLAAAIYPGGYVVPEDKPGITIRGVDRNSVMLAGDDVRRNAIEVEADGVTLENMTAHNFIENGFYWDGVDGFAGRYLTVYNVGLYGIYAIESRNGLMESSYVSGAADAAFYIGECHPCDTTLRDLTATLSAVGYSGTNAGGNLIVQGSLFENNGTGILPNSYDVGLATPPQRETDFAGNVVRGSGSVPTPRQTPLGGFVGIGIGVAGGVDNVIEENEVTGSTKYGIAIFATVDRATTWIPSNNRVEDNTVSGSGTADLALAAGAGDGNCFIDNDAGTTAPTGLGGTCPTAGGGDAAVAAALVRPPPELLDGLPEPPPYADMPVPPPQQSMPIELAEAGSFENGVIIGIVALLFVAGGIWAAYDARPKNPLDPKDRGNIGLRNIGVTLLIVGIAGLFVAGLTMLAARGSEAASPSPTASAGAAAGEPQPIAWLN